MVSSEVYVKNPFFFYSDKVSYSRAAKYNTFKRPTIIFTILTTTSVPYLPHPQGEVEGPVAVVRRVELCPGGGEGARVVHAQLVAGARAADAAAGGRQDVGAELIQNVQKNIFGKCGAV